MPHHPTAGLSHQTTLRTTPPTPHAVRRSYGCSSQPVIPTDEERAAFVAGRLDLAQPKHQRTRPKAVSVGVQAYRDGIQKIIANFAPHLFITLALNRQTTVSAVEAQLRKFHARLDDACLGGQWKQLPERRSTYVGIVEHEHSNIHVHLAVRIDPDVVLRPDEIARQWSLVEPGGTIDIQPATYAEGLGRYMAKDITAETSHRIMVSENTRGSHGAP
jgi:hypothetical protein